MPKLGIMCMTSAATRISCPRLEAQGQLRARLEPLIESRKAGRGDVAHAGRDRVGVSSIVWHSTSTTL